MGKCIRFLSCPQGGRREAFLQFDCAILPWYRLPMGVHRFRSLKAKAFTSLFIFGILPLFFISLVTNELKNRFVEEQVKNIASQSLDTLSLTLFREFQTLLNSALSLSTNSAVLEVLPHEYESDEEREAAFMAIRKEVYSKERISQINYPFSYLLIAKDGTVFTPLTFLSPRSKRGDLQEIKRMNWFRGLYGSRFPVLHFEYRLERFPFLSGNNLHFMSSIVNGYDYAGILILGRSRLSFDRLLEASNIDRYSSVFLTDERLELVAESERNFIPFREAVPKIESLLAAGGSQIPVLSYAGGTYFLFHRSVYFKELDKNFHFVLVTPKSLTQYHSNVVKYLPYSMVILLIFAVFSLLFFVNWQIVGPIIKLNDTVKAVRSGSFAVTFAAERADEIGELQRSFSQMLKSIETYIEDIKSEEKAKRNLEVRVLQSQINPHFIRNTLNTIRWMAEIRGAKGISSALLSFSRMLSYLIDTNSTLARVSDEVSYIEQYVFLEKIRYQNKLSFSASVDEEILGCFVPRLIFQPVAENSIIHGIAPKPSGGELSIRGGRMGNDLLFIIADSGVGMGAERLACLEASLSEDAETAEGIGLANTQKRIRFLFGEGYGIRVRSARDEGTVVEIKLPVITDPDHVV